MLIIYDLNTMTHKQKLKIQVFRTIYGSSSSSLLVEVFAVYLCIFNLRSVLTLLCLT